MTDAPTPTLPPPAEETPPEESSAQDHDASGSGHRLRTEVPKRAGVWENLGSDLLVDAESKGRRRGLGTAPWFTVALVASGLGSLVLLALDATGVAAVHPAWTILAVGVLLLLAARDHIRAGRALAFYGRFVRPGLQRLLREETRMLAGDKLFRGRRTVILKVDMADYTKTTFDMPYGMRRLFVDLWYTLVDRVVAPQVFLDKSLGDGSLYCFEDDLPGGSCSAALRAAVELRDRVVGRFDESFRRRLRARLADEPELSRSAEEYMARYAQRTGHSFWQRRTVIRIALVAGYVDEGLWGLSGQSHYDVQGTPPILATRLEDRARNGEIVFDLAFLEALETENPGLVDRSRLRRRVEELKGIGPWEVWVLPAASPSEPTGSESEESG